MTLGLVLWLLRAQGAEHINPLGLITLLKEARRRILLWATPVGTVALELYLLVEGCTNEQGGDGAKLLKIFFNNGGSSTMSFHGRPSKMAP